MYSYQKILSLLYLLVGMTPGTSLRPSELFADAPEFTEAVSSGIRNSIDSRRVGGLAQLKDSPNLLPIPVKFAVVVLTCNGNKIGEATTDEKGIFQLPDKSKCLERGCVLRLKHPKLKGSLSGPTTDLLLLASPITP